MEIGEEDEGREGDESEESFNCEGGLCWETVDLFILLFIHLPHSSIHSFIYC